MDDLLVKIPKKKLAKRSSYAFEVTFAGKRFKGFVVRKGDAYFAYQNLCQHLPVTLDFKDEKFFTHDKTHLQCQMHGAMYEVETGFCVAGPCQGARLVMLTVTEEEGRLIIKIPANMIADGD